MNPDIKCVRVLIEAGADVNYGYGYGESILDIAYVVDNEEIINLLISNGAKSTEEA